MTKQEAIKWINGEITWHSSFPDSEELIKALYMAIEALEQEPIIYCEYCRYWHEWENGTGSCHRSDIIWVGSDYDDYCSYAERKGSDTE